MLKEFKALIAKHEYLKDDIDNIREDSNGNIIYTYNGIMDCAVINDGGQFGEWGDTSMFEVDAWCEGIYSGRDIRWFDTLEELVATIAEDVNPENLPTPA
jgi:hypothetical protein